MPINLQTGLPGEGKTLFTIDQLIQFDKKQKEEEGEKARPIYYYNIKGLSPTLGWNELTEEQVLKWYEIPKSIILIDECQKIFPILKQGQIKPEHYAKLAEHRHLGIDIYLITQHGQLIDNFVRKLVAYHSYIERKFNSSKTTVYTHRGYIDESRIKKDGTTDTKPYTHNKEIFDLYKSAEMHTIKTKVPRKLKILVPLLIFLLVGAIYLFKSGTSNIMDGEINEDIRPSTDASYTVEVEVFPDVLKDGLLKDRLIYIVGKIIDQYYFIVNDVTLSEEDLKDLGYSVAIKHHCLGLINRTPVTCIPPDYYEKDDEYDEQTQTDEDRRGGNDAPAASARRSKRNEV